MCIVLTESWFCNRYDFDCFVIGYVTMLQRVTGLIGSRWSSDDEKKCYDCLFLFICFLFI